MILSQTDRQKYPKCTSLLHDLGARLSSRRQVRDAFMDACSADDQFRSTPQQARAIAERALRWSTPPRVEVVDGMIRAPEGGKIVDACGFTNTFPGRPPFILITSFWFDAFEFGLVDQDKNAERLTRTLLHEAVHWSGSKSAHRT